MLKNVWPILAASALLTACGDGGWNLSSSQQGADNVSAASAAQSNAAASAVSTSSPSGTAPTLLASAPALGVQVPTPASPVVVAGAKVKTVMFIGDSITRGADDIANTSKTFRGSLFRRLTESGYSVDFIGSQWLLPATGGDPHHEGYNGASIQSTIDRIATMLPAEVAPNVIVLQIGFNDVWGPREGIASRFGALVNALRAAKPGATLVLCTLHPGRGLTEREFAVQVPGWADLTAKIRALANASSTDNILLADVAAAAFTPNDYFDGVHLSQLGADKFGAVVYQTLSSVLAR